MTLSKFIPNASVIGFNFQNYMKFQYRCPLLNGAANTILCSVAGAPMPSQNEATAENVNSQ